METGGIFSAIKTTFAGLSTQMKRMQIISENIANAEREKGTDGSVYHRKVVIREGSRNNVSPRFGEQMTLKLKHSRKGHIDTVGNHSTTSPRQDATDNLKVIEVKGERLVFDPTHPSADEKGYVHMSNVNLVEEMVNLIEASRSYEANVSVMSAAKLMAKRSMEI